MTKRRSTLILNGRGMTRAQMYARETVPVSSDQLKGGAKGDLYSVKDYVPPMKNPRELHAPLANFIGPQTHVRERLMRNIKPTTVPDAGARVHDSEFYNIGRKLARGEITKAQAVAKVRASDNKLIATAKRAPKGPLETAHKLAVVAGITGKKALEDVGLMQGTRFLTMTGDEPDLPEPYNSMGGKRKKKAKPKKKNLLKGLEKRILKIRFKK